MKFVRKTRRLIIRPYRASDYEAWVRANSIMLSQKNTWDQAQKSSSGLTQQTFQKILKAQKDYRAKDVFYDFGIFLKDGTLIGNVSLMDVTRGVFQNAYLGYRIFNHFWGRGYGAEAVRAGIDIAFRELKLHRLEAGVEPGNNRSIRLAKRLGLRKESLSKRRLFLRGEWRDILNYVVTTEVAGYAWKGTARLRGDRL